jgi:hypothetical protein
MITLMWIGLAILAYLVGHYNGEQSAMDEMDCLRDEDA